MLQMNFLLWQSGCKLALLMNFNVLGVVGGIKRLVNKL